MGIRCFLLERTKFVQRDLRRYATGECPGKYKSFHNANKFLDIVVDDSVYDRGDIPSIELRQSLDFPKKCDYCDYVFLDSDEWQINTNHLWEGIDANDVKITCRLEDAPIGAMWDAYWMPDVWKGADGKSIQVNLPPDGHNWSIDGVASNCDKKDDRDHRCWVRHGVPPVLTVDKDVINQPASALTTCGAGAGSIQTTQWHGFLRNGELVEC